MIRSVDYDGDIWCLKVKDNKNFIAERNGRFDFCGNTDEVYGSVDSGYSKEGDVLMPNSPYSASKAAADLLARSYFVTHKLPVIITRSSNNFGPYQYPEKLIPLFITNLIESKKVPLYGDGLNVRDWLYVLDNCSAIDLVMHKGKPGEIYNICGGTLFNNKELTLKILKALNKDEDFIQYVKDRPGHDYRYALDCAKIKNLGWKPSLAFEEALKETVKWYKENEGWWRRLKDKNYQEYYKAQYEKK
jgi:dTDP-glucose 4,6-dehydratase